MLRRAFLKNTGAALAGFGGAPLWLRRAAAAGGAKGKILVAIFQRGAADGLNMVVPHADKNYYALRPTIAIPRPGAGANAALDLDGAFGLHPSLGPLKRLYDAKTLAIVHAVGSPDPTRSHFDAQDYMEAGTPGVKSTRDGWLNRALRAVENPSPVRAVAMGPSLPRALRGRNAAVAVQSLGEFKIRDEAAAAMFQSAYRDTRDAAMQSAGRATFEAMKMLEGVRNQPYSPANGASYPSGRLGQSLREIAQLIKAGVGLEVAFADMGGWDHHVNEAPQLTAMLGEFGGAIEAFLRDLEPRLDDIVLVTMSEFGRTARENGNRGTDHGHANVMFVAGGPVRGGKLYGEFPGLEREQLYEGRDLQLTTDFRDVLAETAIRHLGCSNPDSVFPGYGAPKYREIVRA